MNTQPQQIEQAQEANTWPCGTLKSGNNAFTGATVEPRPEPTARALTNRKQYQKLQAAKAGLQPIAAHPHAITILPSDFARTTRIMRASI